MTNFCDKSQNLCIYFGWCIVVTIFLIVFYTLNRSGLSNAEYIEELKKINYTDKKSAELRYLQIQKEIDQYINSKVNINCYNVYGKYQRRSCNAELENKKNQHKKEYLENILTVNDKILVKLYENQNISGTIVKYAFIGYFLIPFILVSVNTPWYFFL